MNVTQLIKQLELLPHPEGGFFRETYRSGETILKEGLPSRFDGSRHMATAIYFLIEQNNFSALHRIKSDETWHFYAGDALEVIELDEAGQVIITRVGNQLENGEVFQYTVRAGRWFGSRVKKGGAFSLVGCTVAPGFDFRDFEMARRQELLLSFPEHDSLITELTRD